MLLVVFFFLIHFVLYGHIAFIHGLLKTYRIFLGHEDPFKHAMSFIVIIFLVVSSTYTHSIALRQILY